MVLTLKYGVCAATSPDQNSKSRIQMETLLIFMMAPINARNEAVSDSHSAQTGLATTASVCSVLIGTHRSRNPAWSSSSGARTQGPVQTRWRLRRRDAERHSNPALVPLLL